jgi:hypothetical protein
MRLTKNLQNKPRNHQKKRNSMAMGVNRNGPMNSGMRTMLLRKKVVKVEKENLISIQKCGVQESAGKLIPWEEVRSPVRGRGGG